MESNTSNSFLGRIDRELSSLKLLSRLLSHQLHSQSGNRIQLSRDEVEEIRTTLDLFIEKVAKARSAGNLSAVDADTVAARMN